jgi:hypothetical protein
MKESTDMKKQKVKTWWREVVDRRLGKSDRVFVASTPYAPESIFKNSLIDMVKKSNQ